MMASRFVLTMFTERATIRLETDEGEVSVGGLGAVISDVEADRLGIEGIDQPPKKPVTAEEPVTA